VTVLEVIRRSAGFLEKKGVESPRLQVELLLAHLLGLPRMGLYLNFERALTPRELEDLRAIVKRRGGREPLQHILGTTSFWGLELAVNSAVLVPRPETEMLAEMGWEFLNSGGPGGRMPPSTAGGTPAATALDFGTGSGCLAIALACKCPAARVVAVDISPEALVVARQNAARHQVESRIEFILGDGLKAVPIGGRFELIVGNPPYIPSAEIATLEPEVRDHDPRLALDGGVDGKDFYRRLAGEAGDLLSPGGRIMLEFGDGQAEAIEKLFKEQKWIVEAVKADYSAKPRFLTARRDD
jgi:release factor glutamine methyltransferase